MYKRINDSLVDKLEKNPNEAFTADMLAEIIENPFYEELIEKIDVALIHEMYNEIFDDYAPKLSDIVRKTHSVKLTDLGISVTIDSPRISDYMTNGESQ